MYEVLPVGATVNPANWPVLRIVEETPAQLTVSPKFPLVVIGEPVMATEPSELPAPTLVTVPEPPDRVVHAQPVAEFIYVNTWPLEAGLGDHVTP